MQLQRKELNTRSTKGVQAAWVVCAPERSHQCEELQILKDLLLDLRSNQRMSERVRIPET